MWWPGVNRTVSLNWDNLSRIYYTFLFDFQSTFTFNRAIENYDFCLERTRRFHNSVTDRTPWQHANIKTVCFLNNLWKSVSFLFAMHRSSFKSFSRQTTTDSNSWGNMKLDSGWDKRRYPGITMMKTITDETYKLVWSKEITSFLKAHLIYWIGGLGPLTSR